VDRADQMVRIIHAAEKSWNGPRNYVIFAIGGSAKQTDPAQRENEKESRGWWTTGPSNSGTGTIASQRTTGNGSS